MGFVVLWLFIGIVSCLAGIMIFRTDGMGSRRELYLVLLGVVLGPITTVMIGIDVLRKAR